jgi:hypothetical protein
MSDITVQRVIDRLYTIDKRDNRLTADDLFLVVRANIVRYVYIINIYIQSPHQIMDEDGEDQDLFLEIDDIEFGI